MKIGLIGAGYWGKNLARVLRQLDVLSVICDSSSENLMRAIDIYSAPGMHFYNKIENLLKSDIDAVVIATPPQTHFSLAMASLAAGKHVFVEKPMTVFSKEAGILTNKALNDRKILQVGHTFIYNSGIRKLKEYIDNRELGVIKYIDIQYLNLGKYQRGGVILDLAAHGLSVADYLLGIDDTTSVNVKVSKACFNNKNLIDWANITACYSNKVLLNLSINWLHPMKTRKFVVVGSKKMAIFDDINEPRIQLIDKSVRLEESSSSWGNSMANYTIGNIVIPNIQFREPLKEEMIAFIDSIETGNQSIADGKQGQRVVEIIDKIRVMESVL